MFGMGFMEIFLIAIVAIIALGPDKLPTAMVDIAKFIKKIKSGVEDAKSTLDTELNINDMKEEAKRFKAQIENVKSSIKIDTKVDLGLDELMKDDSDSEKKETKKEKKVSLKKEKKKITEIVEEIKEEKVVNDDATNKFKVNFDEDKEGKA